MQKDNLVIIDGKSIFYRGYYAMGHLALPNGTPTGGVYGFAAMLIEMLDKLQPEYIAIAWDKSKTNIRRRREIYPDYKGNRKPAPDDFYAQIPFLMELLEAFHIPLYEFDDYEADDIIGTLAKKAAQKAIQVDIISGDLDMLQIVDENIAMYQTRRGFSDIIRFDIPAIEEKYQLKKEQFLDLKALKGDSSDNIPGVPGVGEKTAVKLLQDYETLDNIYAKLDQITGKTREKLEQGKELAKISKELAQIQFDAPLEFDPDATRLADFDPQKVIAVLKKFQFNSLLRKFTKLFPEHGEKDSSETNDESTPASTKNVKVPENLHLAYDIKATMHADDELAQKILAKKLDFWDLGQADFLLDPLKRRQEQLPLESPDEKTAAYSRQQQTLEKLPKLKKVLTELDFPLAPVLFKMEKAGVKIALERFEVLKNEFSQELTEIEQEIYSSVGREFNLNSPLQLSQVLFEDLKLPTKGIKKTTRGYSTGQKELDKLKNLHPIIARIERYREIAKLLSTYVLPLPALADENQRIHTTYTQNITATGRLSSVNPNLQNIPTRSSDGRRIRECFVAEQGKTFVSADYAQFELRLAAVLSKDQKLIDDFNSGLDIHRKTASDVFHVPLDQVSKKQRRAAKVINFGVLYGMSAKGLADAADMSMKEAKDFIDHYFELRAPIRKYLDDILTQGKKLGYVETYYGRRRPTPDLNAPNFLVRTTAERAAANMPIQGTEADLMKRAMLAVDAALPAGAQLLLQVHDSLIVECEDHQIDEVSKILQNKMEQVEPNLPIKLAVDVTTGKDWGKL